MFEIVVTAEDGSEDKAEGVIQEVFDRYNEYYLMDNTYKKCIVFKTDTLCVDVYFFPLLPKDSLVEKVLVTERSYNHTISIFVQGQDKKYPVQGIRSVYPTSFDKNTDFFEYIECNFYKKIPIGRLTIEEIKFICSRLNTGIKKREESNTMKPLGKEPYFIRPSGREKCEHSLLDLNAIWENSFSKYSPCASDELELSRVDVECKLLASDPEEYEVIKERTNILYATCCSFETEYSISVLFCEMFRLSFLCSSYEKKIINSFKRHRWVISDGGICLRKAISVEFPRKLFYLSSKSKNKNIELDRTIQRICLVIQNQSFRNKLFNDCCEILYNERFVRAKNAKDGLIAFSNGVYDLEQNSLRYGMPNDYITLSTNIPYRKFDEDSAEVEALMNFLHKVFPIDSVLNYFIRFMSSCLEGGNRDKIFSIWSGLGDNGKSVLVNLITITFGEYSVKLPTSMLTGKRSQSGNATPELAMIEGMLISFLQEPDEGEKMNLGIVKELTGNDSIYVRGMYEKGNNIRIRSKFVLIANRIPQLSVTDRAAWNRVRVIPFLSTFVDEVGDTVLDGKFTFKKDPNFSDNLPYLAPVFMYLLTEEYKNYKKYGLEEPEAITQYTKDLKMANDPLEQFIQANIQTDSTGNENIKDLYESYKSWFKDMFPSSKTMDSTNFSRELKKKGFNINSIDQVIGVKRTGYL